MNRLVNCFIAVVFFFAAASTSEAQELRPAANWDRAAALHTIDRPAVEERLKGLLLTVRSAGGPEVLQSLSDSSRDRALSAPARDYLVYRFAAGLGDLEPGAVGPQVLDYLAAYEVETLVPHEDHPRAAVPLFNVRAAAAGTRSRWERLEAAGLAGDLLRASPDRWLGAYLAAGPAGRRGFADALDAAPEQKASELGWYALALPDGPPELTVVAARAGLRSGDMKLLRESVAQGAGPGLRQVIERAGRDLPGAEAAGLLAHAVEEGGERQAALAIAVLAPALIPDPEVEALLFGKLSDRGLGSAAALVLGASSDPAVRSRLLRVASGDKGLAAQRAEWALKVPAAGATGEL